MKFTNYFLLSMPHMDDLIFGRSIIFICEHDNKGAMGLIINKPFQSNKVNSILKKVGLDILQPNPNIYFGGPVGINNGFFLHTSKYSIDGTFQISDKLSLTSNNLMINDINQGKGPKKYQFSLGYTGWKKDQLDKEVENGDWLVFPSSSKLIFDIPDEKKWNMASSELGIDIMNITGKTGIA